LFARLKTALLTDKFKPKGEEEICQAKSLQEKKLLFQVDPVALDAVSL
jgi:hypothetical protein